MLGGVLVRTANGEWIPNNPMRPLSHQVLPEALTKLCYAVVAGPVPRVERTPDTSVPVPKFRTWEARTTRKTVSNSVSPVQVDVAGRLSKRPRIQEIQEQGPTDASAAWTAALHDCVGGETPVEIGDVHIFIDLKRPPFAWLGKIRNTDPNRRLRAVGVCAGVSLPILSTIGSDIDDACFEMHILRPVPLDASDDSAVTFTAQRTEETKNPSLAIGARDGDQWVLDRFCAAHSRSVQLCQLGPCVTPERVEGTSAKNVHVLSDADRWLYAVLQYAAVVALEKE